MNSTGQEAVRCRQISEFDIDAVTKLLVRRFPRRSSSYWLNGFERLARRDTIENYPRFGYLVECGGAPVGVLLMIFASRRTGDVATVQCNLSSWCTEPEYSGYSSLLVRAALKQRPVIYLNVSPASHTRQTIVAQGFSCYSRGQYLALPALSLAGLHAVVEPFNSGADYGDLLARDECVLLTEHAACDCIALTCAADGQLHPFVFLPRRIGIGPFGVPCAQLCYCRDIDDFLRFAGPLGRALAALRLFCVLIDANGPIKGLPGRYFPDRAPKYFSGPHPPRLGDLAYTEAIIFGP